MDVSKIHYVEIPMVGRIVGELIADLDLTQETDNAYKIHPEVHYEMRMKNGVEIQGRTSDSHRLWLVLNNEGGGVTTIKI